MVRDISYYTYVDKVGHFVTSSMFDGEQTHPHLSDVCFLNLSCISFCSVFSGVQMRLIIISWKKSENKRMIRQYNINSYEKSYANKGFLREIIPNNSVASQKFFTLMWVFRMS